MGNIISNNQRRDIYAKEYSSVAKNSTENERNKKLENTVKAGLSVVGVLNERTKELKYCKESEAIPTEFLSRNMFDKITVCKLISLGLTTLPKELSALEQLVILDVSNNSN